MFITSILHVTNNCGFFFNNTIQYHMNLIFLLLNLNEYTYNPQVQEKTDQQV